jgi:hypothetical protein
LATEVAKKKVGLTSPMPLSELSPFSRDGMWMIGTIVRVIRFQRSLNLKGITGWKLSTFSVRSRGPKLKSVLFWKGTLIRLAIGFCACFASACVSSLAGLVGS